MGLVTEYPFWFVLLCILLAAGYAGGLYFRARADISSRMRFLLTAFRFLSVFLISFLLLSPLVRKTTKTIEKPVVVIGLDNSQSVAMGRDSSFYRTEYPKLVEAFENKLKSKAEVRIFTFGDHLREGAEFTFTDKTTNISDFITGVEDRFSNRNVSAVVLCTDGLYNRGVDPFYTARDLAFPVYSVALGDTVRQRDLLIRRVVYNRQAFPGDRFPVEIRVEASKMNGERSILKVMKGDETLVEEPFLITGDHFSRSFTVMLEARGKGIQRYTVVLDPVPGEFTAGNNRQEVFVEVLEERDKVMILYDAPHPDITALRSAVASSARFEVTDSRFSDFRGDPSKYDLIVLYQLPSVSGVINLDPVLKSKTSILYVLGARSDLFAFNKLNTGLVITSQKVSWNESQPLFNPAFPLFTVDPDAVRVYEEFPPLLCPFGTYQTNPVSNILFYQKMGSVNTQFPLIMFFEDADRKTGVIAGENLWRWRISDYAQKGNHDVFDELISKIFQFLSVKGDKSFFRVKAANRFMENEPVLFSAEVYNESYELINDPDVSITITDPNGKTYPFTFSKTGTGYVLNAGNYPPGDYTYSATTSVGNKKYIKTGSFVIASVNLESLDLVADKDLLLRMAVSHDGMLTSPADLDSLADRLLGGNGMRSIAHYSRRYTDLAGALWLFLLILGLLSTEWVIRKRSGM